LLAAETEPHENFFRAVLDVETAGDLKVKTQAFILLKELVEGTAARGLHSQFELSHPRQGCQGFIESELGFLPDRSLALESRLLRQDGHASTTGDRDFARRCGVKTGNDPQQGRFSGAVDAD